MFKTYSIFIDTQLDCILETVIFKPNLKVSETSPKMVENSEHQKLPIQPMVNLKSRHVTMVQCGVPILDKYH